MAKLNLTEKERRNVSVDFDINRFVAMVNDGIVIGQYSSQERMDSEFRENDIRVTNMSPQAFYLAMSGYGNKTIMEGE